MKQHADLLNALERALPSMDPATIERLRALLPVAAQEDDGYQLDFGSNSIVIGTTMAARGYVSSAAGTNGPFVVEDCVVYDKNKFIELRDGSQSAVITWEGKYDVKHAGPDAELAKRSTLTYRAAMSGTNLDAGSLTVPTSQTVTEFKLTTSNGDLLGYLFRKHWVDSTSGEDWLEDHWVLTLDHTNRTVGDLMEIVHVTDSADLNTRLTTLKSDANGTDPNRPDVYTKRVYRVRKYEGTPQP